MLEAKRLGFTDGVIGTLADRLPEQVRQQRHDWHIQRYIRWWHTCAAEFDAGTPYFYSTYEEENEAEPMSVTRRWVIGQRLAITHRARIEFDYCSVHAAWALKQSGYGSIMINSNPRDCFY